MRSYGLPPKWCRVARRRGLVAVVGRPNVGKSTLVNRLAAGRGSIVSPEAGLTRDVIERRVEWGGRTFTVLDAGGVAREAVTPRADPETVAAKVGAKAMEVAEEAELILLVLDTQTGVTSDDMVLVGKLRKMEVPVLVVANKVDDQATESQAAEMWSLGMGEPLPVSALHGRGSDTLLDRIAELLPEGDPEPIDEVPSVAIVGRPNVGKSSLFNRLAGSERAIVHHEPGTTRDSIDTVIEIGERAYRFIDTAGLRRRAKTSGVEVYGAGRTRSAIARADVAVLVVDAAEGATSQDQRIAETIAKAGVGAVVALNKWDLITGEELASVLDDSLRERLHFVSHAPMIRTSATSARGVGKLVDQIDVVLSSRLTRLPTAALNTLVQDAQQQHPPRRVKGRTAKVLYATQTGVAPPTFVLFASGPLEESWLRFLEGRLRERFEFTGNPIKFLVRERKEKAKGSRRS